MIRSLRIELLALAILATVSPGTAGADDLQEARRRFGLGQELFARGSYEEAYTWYESAYEAAPLADFLFNMGQCQRNLGNVPEALALYRRFLSSNPPEDKRLIVEDLVHELELIRPDLARPPGEGDHGSGGQSSAGSAGASAGAGEGGQVSRRPGRSPGLLARLRAPTWIAAAGAVVLAGAGGLLALRAQQGQDELDGLHCESALEECLDTRDEAQGYFLARNVTLAAAGVALGTAIVLAILDASAAPEESDVAVVPIVGPGLAAIGARGAF